MSGNHLIGAKTNQQQMRLSTKLRLIVFVILLLTLIEHSLSIKKFLYYAELCPQVEDLLRGIFVQHFNELFYFTGYTPAKAAWARFMITVCTFTWSWMDCFISIVSVGLSTRFNQINLQLKAVKGLVGNIVRFENEMFIYLLFNCGP